MLSSELLPVAYVPAVTTVLLPLCTYTALNGSSK